MKERLAIFDMDETLVTSNFTWALAASRYLDRIGVAHDDSIDNAYYEHGISFVISMLQDEYGIKRTEREIFQALTEETLEDYRNRVSLKKSASDAVALFKKSGFFTCVLSANSMQILNIVRERFSSELEMDGWFSTRNLPWSKSDGRVYDLVSSFFGLVSKDCILIDDAEYAISTADRIGLKHYCPVNYSSKEKTNDVSFDLSRIKEIIVL